MFWIILLNRRTASLEFFLYVRTRRLLSRHTCLAGKWSGDSRYPGALLPEAETFRRAFSPGPTDCPWVSEDELKRRRSDFPVSPYCSLQSQSCHVPRSRGYLALYQYTNSL